MSGRLDGVLARSLAFAVSVVGRLPRALARELCALSGFLYATLGGPRVADARVNLHLALPERSERERERILRESFANLGRSFAEACSLWVRGPGAEFDRVTIEGLENLERAKEQSGREGALVVSAHLGSWEFCAAALAHRGIPITAVQRGFENRMLAHRLTEFREAVGLETLPLGGAALGLFRALARGRYVALLMDQNAKQDEGVFAPFFSISACTRSGPVAIAMTRGTPVVPVFFYRVGKSGAHVVRIGAPLEIDRDENPSPARLAENVGRMNAAIEAAIRSAPEQWIWTHRRFKTRPLGAEAVYPPQRSSLRSLRHGLRGLWRDRE